MPDVSGVQPAVANCFRCFRGFIPVALHNAGTFNHKLAGFSCGELTIFIVKDFNGVKLLVA